MSVVQHPAPLVFGDLDDGEQPLAICLHGFPDTPNTWRYLGPALAEVGYRVVAPWLPGYGAPFSRPVDVGTYVRHILDTHRTYGGDERALIVGHDWGAHAGYGAVAAAPETFDRLVTLAVPPTAALGPSMFGYRQVKRSAYLWLIQQVGLAESVLLEPGFWEALWADWSPAYDARDDIAEMRRHVNEDTIAGVINPYRASFDQRCADPETAGETTASLIPPQVPTLYLHGADDGAIGAELLGAAHQSLPHPDSAFALVPGVGHFLHLEQPEAIWHRIRDWLSV